MRSRARLLFLTTVCALAAPAQPADGNLTDLDLEALMQMDVEVTTVSKSKQSIYTVPAPIYVITAEDIRRSGVSSIPESLRLAPGVVVGQIDPSRWVVGLRGFAWEYANKALILLDGRPVYSPLNSSVYWNSLDVPMEDIERIEVIRGPGDARWGSHAVNGIVNIITRSAADTPGTAVSALVDSSSGATATIRHGGTLREGVAYRAYARYLEQGDFDRVGGLVSSGQRSAVRTGFRLDGTLRDVNRFTVVGELQDGRDTSLIPGQNFVPFRYDADEWSVIGRWERGTPGRLSQQLQLSFDRLDQSLYEERRTFDASYQIRLPEMHFQAVTMGASFKRSSDVLPAYIVIIPPRLTQNTYGVFLHDAITLGPRNHLSLSSQFEHNPFTGWEVQPNLQFIHEHAERRSYWVSVSRAVRTPLRTEDGFRLEFPIGPGVFVRGEGDRNLRAEEVLAYQAGVRFGFREDLFIDIAAFYNEYEDLIIQRSGVPIFEPGRVVFPAVYANSTSGYTKGVEVVVKALPIEHWNVTGSVSLFAQSDWSDPLGFGAVTGVRHQYQLHSSSTLRPNLHWNADLYYTGALTTGDVPSYYRFDTQLSWGPSHQLEVALGIRNAFERRHQEAGANTVDAPTWIPRMAYLRLHYQF